MSAHIDNAVVLVVGSLHYDIMIATERLPQKDETAVGSRWFPKFGGKGGNQAVSAAQHGAMVRFVGAVGADDFGQFLRRNLTDAGLDDSQVTTIANVGSGMSVAISDAHGDYAATIVSGANLHIDPAGLADSAIWAGVNLLVLQNEVPEAVNIAASQAAHLRGVPVLLNAAPSRELSPLFQALVDILVVNAVEAHMMGAEEVFGLDSAARAARTLASRFRTVIVTAGAQGLAVSPAVGDAFEIPAENVIAISSHGAGDAFIGALAAKLAAKADLKSACIAASQAAARHVATG